MLKIAIIGPESTGKTELAKALSEYFASPWVPEYARAYVENLQKAYSFDDVCNIAKKQIELEQSFTEDTAHFVFFDTDLIITKVWFEYCYQSCPDFVVERLDAGYFDLYLLCFPDLEWKADSVREHGDDREFFFDWYQREIERIHKPYALISGQGETRVQNAIDALSSYEKS